MNCSTRIHIERVGAGNGHLADVGALQRARPCGRPLLSGCGSFAHGLAVAEPETRGIRLRCGTADDAQLAAEAANRALTRLASLRQLLPGNCSEHIVTNGSSVWIGSSLPGYVLQRVLDSPKALPSTVAGSSADRVEWLECDADEAVAEFERGNLQATAPTCFEVAHACAADRRLRSANTDVFALLLVDPRRRDRWALVNGRRLLRERLAAELEQSQQVVVVDGDVGASVHLVLPAPYHSAAELSYADFWPNGVIARILVAAMAELGTLARACPLSLSDLHARTVANAFDLALVLVSGYAGPLLSLPLALARAALGTGQHDMRLRDAFATAIAGPETGPAWGDLSACALQIVPAIPLCRFRGGFLADPDLPDHPLAYGCVLPVEHYTGACTDA